MPKVSVIVPVYNVAHYLSRCLDSLLNQTLTDIEIICVNDAATDGSDLILAEYGKRDSRITILTHKCNKGLGPARNTGVAHANALYIGFVDSDDFVAPQMFDSLYKTIVDVNAQMAWCSITCVEEDGVATYTESIPQGSYSIEYVLNEPLLYPSILPVWNKLFCRHLLKDIEQLPIVGEDQPVMAEYLLKCERIAIINAPFYYYRNRQGSLSKPNEQLPADWDSFFHSHKLFFDIMELRYRDTPVLNKQIILRHFSLVRNIEAARLVYTSNWPLHKQKLLHYLKHDTLNLRKANPVMYFYIMFVLRIKWPATLAAQLLLIARKLSRSTWLLHKSACFLPFDIMRVILLPSIKNLVLTILLKCEITIYQFLASVFRLVKRHPSWLVCERPDTAQENGYYFYRYLRTAQPQENVYYILQPHSAQYNMVTMLGPLVPYNTLRHRVLFYACTYFVSSHDRYSFPLSIVTRRRLVLPERARNIFLQHGITLADNSAAYGKQRGSISLFICGASPEYSFVKTCFGYSPAEVKYTGFARFDGLHDNKTKRQILLMPSWRKTIWSNDRQNSTKYFRSTAYFKCLQSLLNNAVLTRLLDEYDYRLVFYPHYEVQKYLTCFTTPSDRVVLADKCSYTVQQLLKESALLVTDSSSVSFDFAYMYKPVLYYHLPEDVITRIELDHSYFQDREAGFGEVLEDENNLLEHIHMHLNHDCEMNERFKERVRKFFPLHDANNCDRIYHAIMDERQVITADTPQCI